MRTPKKDVCLPVIPASATDHHGPRPSRSGRWRAVSLLLVHIFMLAHALQWLRDGRTVTPIEPSESMETLITGRINAGFIFFAVAILLTIVLGRWLCGWGCHLVAYQDLTNWLLKKLRLRPKAFRSRVLILAPLLAALYMFVWPAAYRLAVGAPQPRLTAHLTTTGFWDTFPQYGIAALTVLICGVAIIYLLGPKGFCTYACPYGAFFGLADKLALFRIRVTDACRQCGHCTAVCTSNVKVSEEVNLYKMVVDPGCMKCLDCVSVCPNDALYYGFGFPSLGAKPLAAAASASNVPRRYDLTLAEELAAALIFVAAFFSFRGLYGKLPFLLSLGIAGIIAYLVMKAARLIYARDVLIQRTRLKSTGRIRPFGIAYLFLTAAIVGLMAHSGYWRYHDYLGNLAFEKSPPELFGWQYQPDRLGAASDEQQSAVAAGIHHLEKARRSALALVPENDRELAWLYLQMKLPDRAAAAIRRALHSEPKDMIAWAHLAKIETLRGDLAAARGAYQKALSLESARRADWTTKLGEAVPMPGAADLLAEWGLFQAHCGETDAADATLRWAAQYDAVSPTAHLALGLFQIRMNQIDAARASLIRAVAASPHAPEPRRALADLCKEPQSYPAAIDQYTAALRDHPAEPVYLHNRAYALTQLNRYAEAAADYRAVLKHQPSYAEARANLGAILLAQGDIPGAAREYEQLLTDQPANPEAAIRLGYIYLMSNRPADAHRLLQGVLTSGDRDQRRTAQSLLSQLAP
ncbi:MAG TPA: tetratricopeptide repeat protein [Phycisphaerae bacterium]|nr:tetratricopeptide repeat protein [Phycisphaerae bacterium]